jgi:hypothetical protein
MSQRLIYPVVSMCLRMMNRSWAFLCFALLICVSAANLPAQTTNATINGQITDPKGGVVPGTEVHAVNIDTNVVYPTKTNGSGIYAIPALPPGRYRLVVLKDGFKEINKTGITLHVQDTLEQNFSLEVGSTSESITVSGSGNVINTTDASVSTVVDRQFVENMPLNGRSLQSLIALTPGVVQTPLTYGSSPGDSGEFSVNGQRTEANYYTVDGVSANVGVSENGTFAAGSAGLLPSQTALGTTQSMASIDALQEFRIDTSTYAAEYGRTPGGQISLQTRSGTNELHGTLSDYFRNDALDANNWFNDHTTPITAKTAERQNDFGGTLGGPVYLPHLYDGRQRTFFFYSYEGLRLAVPTAATTTEVPDAYLRQTAPSEMDPIINAFPVSNGSEVSGVTGLAYFTGAYSLPSSLDTNSARIDHSLGSKTHIFGRFSNSTSSTNSRASTDLANVNAVNSTDRSITAGVTRATGSHATNEARFNYTWTQLGATDGIDSYGGAQPATLSDYLSSSAPPYSIFAAFLEFGSLPGMNVDLQQMSQTQWNLVDTQQIVFGHHSVKVGIDYRRVMSTQDSDQFGADLVYFSASEIQYNSTGFDILISDGLKSPKPIFTNYSAFIQDEWKVNTRNTLSLGLRWDVNPPPTNGNGRIPPVLDQITNLATATLAPAGTPEWNTYYAGLAPRIGFATQLNNRSGRETILRVGIGNFFDSGNAQAAIGFTGLGFGTYQVGSSLSFPLAAPVYNLPAPSTAVPYNATVVGYDRNLKLPYTLHWNLSLEQSLGESRSLTVGYVASAGRRLLAGVFQDPEAVNPAFSIGDGAYIIQNGSWSNYQSLQAQFQQHLSHGLQVLASMTWSHSIDNLSNNFISFTPLLKGDSDFDVRQNFQAAVTYAVPSIGKSSLLVDALSKGWAIDLRDFLRTAAPVDIYGNVFYASNGTEYYSRPNIVPEQPFYLYGSRNVIPGGKEINLGAFTAASNGLGDAPRNFLRGFGSNEIDMALRREFGLTKRAKIQFRVEAFNVLNDPNFGAIYNSTVYGPAQFGQAYNTLNESLKGQSSLYAQGGPRSLQLALKVLF